jgi:hypothetical protein
MNIELIPLTIQRILDNNYGDGCSSIRYDIRSPIGMELGNVDISEFGIVMKIISSTSMSRYELTYNEEFSAFLEAMMIL